jgi:hypothetical protein
MMQLGDLLLLEAVENKLVDLDKCKQLIMSCVGFVWEKLAKVC